MRTTYESLPMSSCPVRIQKFIDHNSRDHIHWHEEIELLYFIGGEGVISCNLREYNVKKGDIVFFNGKELHTGCIRGHHIVYYCIHINKDFFHNLIGNEYVIFHNIITSDECADLLSKMIEEVQKSGYESLISVKKMMYEFFDLMGKFYTTAVLSEDEYKKQFHRLDTFNFIIEYIDRHCNEVLTVHALAEHFFLSPSYFAHLFKKRANKSVTEYINEVRIKRAKSFLEREALSVGEIAYCVGFNDINYFSRKFKAITNMTPTEYRNKYRIRN